MGDIEQGWVAVKDICSETGAKRSAASALVRKLGLQTRKDGAVVMVQSGDAEILRREMLLPVEMCAQTHTAQVISPCKNTNWVYCKILERKDGFRHPVLIPRRFANKLTKGKKFNAELIRDKNGETYRHEWFAKVRHFKG